jgi:hypothetical protein
VEYDDGLIACGSDALLIRRYTLLLRPRRVPYSDIRNVTKLQLGTMRKWRIWGSGDFLHWWNFDARRPRKEIALALDVGGRVRPTITPDDPQRVVEILRRRGVHVSEPV